MIPGVVLNMLASMSKFSNARYFSIFEEEEVNIYNAATTKITTLKPSLLKGCRDTVSTLWRIPLVKQARGPDDGQMTSRVPGDHAKSWDPKKTYSPLTPHPGDCVKRLPA